MLLFFPSEQPLTRFFLGGNSLTKNEIDGSKVPLLTQLMSRNYIAAFEAILANAKPATEVLIISIAPADSRFPSDDYIEIWRSSDPAEFPVMEALVDRLEGLKDIRSVPIIAPRNGRNKYQYDGLLKKIIEDLDNAYGRYPSFRGIRNCAVLNNGGYEEARVVDVYIRTE